MVSAARGRGLVSGHGFSRAGWPSQILRVGPKADRARKAHSPVAPLRVALCETYALYGMAKAMPFHEAP